jgi:hypothetical protein
MLLMLLACGSFALAAAAASQGPPAPFHPAIVLRDQQGQSAAANGAPVSPMQTCGACHDTRYIAQHSFHAGAGLGEGFETAIAAGSRPWDFGNGLLGRWDPLTYATPVSMDGNLDLEYAAWMRQLGFRHAGGGPGLEVTGNQAEMNCFICHLAAPDNAARIAELEQGRFGWAATATLNNTGLVQRSPNGWSWNASAFSAADAVTAARLGLGRPTSANCGQCHGAVDSGTTPLQLSFNLRNWSTETTGQVYSPQRLNASGLNLHDKATLSRPWDIHAERLLSCADCHFALNNPIASREARSTKPGHVLYDPRKISLGQYLRQPRHGFAKGDSAQGLVAPETDGSMRRCEECHAAEQTHSAWLPYAKRHLRALSCEACHIPHAFAPARSVTDWTMLTATGGPHVEYRGGKDASSFISDADLAQASTLLAGYQPVLLPRQLPGGTQQLMPYNIIVSWYWVGETPAAAGQAAKTLPVSREILRRALLPQGKHAPELLAALDADRDGRLANVELRLDTPAKVQAAAQRLATAGISNPRIVGELAPYDLHHDVATAQWATKTCTACHARASRLSAPMVLSSSAPPGAKPRLLGDRSVTLAGWLYQDHQQLRYIPENISAGLYVLGHDRWLLGDSIGAGAVLLALLAIALHGGLRIVAAYRQRRTGGAR